MQTTDEEDYQAHGAWEVRHRRIIAEAWARGMPLGLCDVIVFDRTTAFLDGLEERLAATPGYIASAGI